MNIRLHHATTPERGGEISPTHFEHIPALVNGERDVIHAIHLPFLVEYSEEQGHRIEFKGVRSKKKAIAALEAAMHAYQTRNPS